MAFTGCSVRLASMSEYMLPINRLGRGGPLRTQRSHGCGGKIDRPDPRGEDDRAMDACTTL